MSSRTYKFGMNAEKLFQIMFKSEKYGTAINFRLNVRLIYKEKF